MQAARFSRPVPRRLSESLRSCSALSIASIDGTVLAPIVESCAKRAEALPAVTETEIESALSERRERFAHAEIEFACRSGCFARVLSQGGRRMILEVKAASPSRGLMREEVSPAEYALAYDRFADAVSVLTEPEFFGGSFERLADLRCRISRPILAKDFIVSGRQLIAAARSGADAVLLMLSVLSDEGYAELAELAGRLGLEILTEASSEAEALRAAALGARIIGLNNRNLRTLEVDRSRAPRIARALDGKLPQDTLLVAESGYSTFSQIAEAAADAPNLSAFLCGSALSESADLSEGVRKLLFGESKVCGITRAEDALEAARAGALTAGIILARRSSRCVQLERAAALAGAIRREAEAEDLPLQICAVLDADELIALPEILEALRPDALQIHGDLAPEACAELAARAPGVRIIPVAAIRPECPDAEAAAPLIRRYLAEGAHRVLLDAAGKSGSGGTGSAFDSSLVKTLPEPGRLLLAGGLTPANIGARTACGAAGFDFNSGVEDSPGIKSPQKIRAAFAALRGIRAPDASSI